LGIDPATNAAAAGRIARAITRVAA
jgi:hypothetical protein